MMFLCNNCRKQIMVADHIGDYDHNCNDFPEIAVVGQEDIVNVGTSTEPDGSTYTAPGGNQIMMQGTPNTLFGTKGWVEGAKPLVPTPRGNDALITRPRTHFEYNNLSEVKTR